MRRLALVAALLGAAAASSPLLAVSKYVAMGDSITAASSWPLSSCGGPCPIVFDCTGLCDFSNSQSVRDECGYVRRLEDWLGAGFDVRNRGIGAESTVAAVLRFPTEMTTECPGSPGDCVAVVMMHGTNDMGSISPESVRDNVANMIGEAKSRNIDTLLMSIIRDYDPNATAWSAYHTLIVDLAASEDLELVDTHATLCTTASCRNANYFLQNVSCETTWDLSTAHLDPEGYDVLTGLIQAKFPGSTPLAPTPTAPIGDITDTTPDFVWDEAATARWYRLDVDGAITWWEAAEHCTGGTCTVDPGVTLAEGSHTWKVQGRNLRGLGAEATTDFDVWGVPGTPTPTAPADLFVDGTPQTAPFAWEPFQWSKDAKATDYDIEVSNGGGSVFSDSFTSSSCSGSVCTGSPGEGLDAGEYTWTVQARNPGASGPVSAALAFEVWATVPEKPVPVAPTGDWFTPFEPLYQWQPAKGAEEYDLEVKDMALNVDYSATNLLASTVCSGGICSHQGGILASPDVYAIEVMGRNSVGDGPPSTASVEFTVLACSDATLEDLSVLEPSPVTTIKVVAHCGPVTGSSVGPYTVDVGGDLTVNTRDGFTAYNGFTVKGDLTIRTP